MNKPCWMRRKDLALLAASALAEAETVELRVHLRQCPGCRARLDALQLIVSEHEESARDLPFIETSPGFHRRIEERIQGAGGDYQRGEPEGRFVRLRIGWLWAGLAGAICVLLVVWPRRQPVSEELVVQESKPAKIRVVEPTQIVFRQALNRSFDEFDQVLAQNGGGRSSGPEREQRRSLAIGTFEEAGLQE